MIGLIFILAIDNGEKKLNENISEVTASENVASKANNIGAEKLGSVEKEDGGISLLYITIIVLSLTTLVAAESSFYLYKWRRTLINNSNLLVPEQWGSALIDMAKSVSMLEKSALQKRLRVLIFREVIQGNL